MNMKYVVNALIIHWSSLTLPEPNTMQLIFHDLNIPSLIQYDYYNSNKT